MSGDTQFHTQLHSIPCHIFLPIVGHHLHHLPGLSHCQKRYINSLLTLTEDTIFRDLPGLSPYHSNSAWELYWSSNSTQHCETFLDCLNITATLRESYISHQTSPRILAPSWTVSVSQQLCVGVLLVIKPHLAFWHLPGLSQYHSKCTHYISSDPDIYTSFYFIQTDLSHLPPFI
jgi:hypothetical protein